MEWPTTSCKPAGASITAPRGPQPTRPDRRRQRAAPAPPRASAGNTENPLVTLLVGASTAALRLGGVGEREYKSSAAAAPAAGRPLRRGDVTGLLRSLRRDFERNQYFVSGIIENLAIYEPDCLFADPTVSFRGRETYQRNLALVAAFLEEPRIELQGLRRLPATARGAAMQLQARWVLTCFVRLPWAPFVRVNGSTTYTLNASQSAIVSHVEAWDVSAVQALLLLLRPSERAAWRRRAAAPRQPGRSKR